ncbi:MAG: AIR synthase-related protein, partial [bacterium]
EDLAAQKFLTKGDITNREYLDGQIQIDDKISEDMLRVLYDPQTSGGLLISISSEVAEEFVEELKKQGVVSAQIVGRVTKENPGKIVVVQA